MRRHTKQPELTATLCLHLPPWLRAIVEEIADNEQTSLGEAGRILMSAGAKALGIAEGCRSWDGDGSPSDLNELEDLAASRIEKDRDREGGR
jgi:hypothetical protein